MKKIFLIAAMIFVMSVMPRVFAGQFIPGEQLEAMAKAEIEVMLNQRGEFRDREISLQRQIPNINLPNGVIEIKLTIPTVNYFGVTPVKARIFVGGRMYRDVNFVMLVQVFDSVLVANHDLRIEVPVTESDFRIEEVPIDGRTEYIQDAQEIVGLVPHRLIRAGSPITVSYFQQPVAVGSNQPVKIVVHYKGIVAAAEGITLTRGRIGEVIKVKNEASKKVLSARVVDSQTVEVIF